jgi:fluoroquinolone transport system permease protein
MRFLQALKQDIKYQFRNGFYYVHLFVSIIYIAILFKLPFEIQGIVTAMVIFSDPAMLGFFFVGAIILLEKEENIFEALFITPLKVKEFIAARVFSLSTISLLTAFLIAIVIRGFHFNYILLFISLILTAIFFTLQGLTIAIIVKTVNEYLIYSIIYSIILVIPFLEFLNIYENILFYLWPTRASLVLIYGAFISNVGLYEIIYSILVLIVWIFIAYKLAYSYFNKYVILKIGDKR